MIGDGAAGDCDALGVVQAAVVMENGMMARRWSLRSELRRAGVTLDRHMGANEDPIETAPGQPVFATAGGDGFVGLSAVSMLLSGALLATVSCTRGRFNSMFAAFNTEMPAITDVVGSPWFLAVVAAFFGLTVIGRVMLRNKAALASVRPKNDGSPCFLGRTGHLSGSKMAGDLERRAVSGGSNGLENCYNTSR